MSMVKNSEIPGTSNITKRLARQIRYAIENKGLTQNDVGEIIDRSQAYASVRIKGMRPWNIDELD